jgi:hypothetical protein
VSMGIDKDFAMSHNMTDRSVILEAGLFQEVKMTDRSVITEENDYGAKKR